MKIYSKEVDKCVDCPAFRLHGRAVCLLVDNNDNSFTDISKIPLWCPLENKE
jgi:hypothetical protein